MVIKGSLRIQEIHTVVRSGSTAPVVGTTIDGQKFIKLMGSGDSTYALISEFIINSIAHIMGLPVLQKELVFIDEATKLSVLYEEVRDMVRNSYGPKFSVFIS